MEILPADERMCRVLSPSADKMETVLKVSCDTEH